MWRKFCDRCNNEVKTSQPRAKDITVNDQEHQFCDNCTTSFTEWLEKGQLESAGWTQR